MNLLDESAASDSRPSVLVFRRDVLLPTESFVANQAAAMTRYRPILLGTRAVPGSPVLPLPAVIATGKHLAKPAELALMLGIAPGRFRRAAEQSEVVHAHFGRDGALLVRALERGALASKPFVVTFHGYDATVDEDTLRTMGRATQLFVERRLELFSRANAIVAVSDFVARRLVQLGADPRKVIVHYIGTNTSFFRPPEGSVPAPPHVVFVGRLRAQKGPQHLLEALAILRSQGVATACTIAGTGPDEIALRAQARAAGLDVAFPGMIDAARVRALFQEARVLCVPAFTPAHGGAEAFGLAFIEAQACGVPVVSFASGGIPEAVADGHTALLAPEGDVEGLADRLRLLLTDDSVWLKLSRAARERVVSSFDLRRQTNELERIYDRVTAAGGLEELRR